MHFTNGMHEIELTALKVPLAVAIKIQAALVRARRASHLAT